MSTREDELFYGEEVEPFDFGPLPTGQVTPIPNYSFTGIGMPTEEQMNIQRAIRSATAMQNAREQAHIATMEASRKAQNYRDFQSGLSISKDALYFFATGAPGILLSRWGVQPGFVDAPTLKDEVAPWGIERVDLTSLEMLPDGGLPELQRQQELWGRAFPGQEFPAQRFVDTALQAQSIEPLTGPNGQVYEHITTRSAAPAIVGVLPWGESPPFSASELETKNEIERRGRFQLAWQTATTMPTARQRAAQEQRERRYGGYTSISYDPNVDDSDITGQRDNAAVATAMARGMEAYRDSYGRIQFFDDVTMTWMDPRDFERNLIGGFDHDYIVKQRTSLGSAGAGEAVGYNELATYWARQGVRVPYATPHELAQAQEGLLSRERAYTRPLYYQGDEWGTFAGMDSDSIAAVQERMVATGYLQPGNFTPGVWDYYSAEGARYLMTDSNGNGVTWVEMMNEVERAGGRPGVGGGPRGGGISISPFVAPEYIRPDFATLKQAVRGSIASILGRDPMDYELKLLSDTLGADYRLQYDSEVEAARKEYDRQVAAIRSGARYAAAGGEVQGVNPLDRLNESILDRYSAEIDRTEDIGERAANTQLVLQALGVLERQVR